MAATISTAIGLQDQTRQHAEEWLETRADLVDSAIRQTLDDTVDDLAAFAGLLNAYPETTQAEMARFAERIQVSQGIVVTAFVRAVPAERLDEFVSEMRRDVPGFRITELDKAAGMVAAGDRDVFYPVQFLVPGPFLMRYAEAQPDFGVESPLGFDAASTGEWAEAVERVLETGELVVSDFFSLGELNIGKAFMILDPVSRDGEIVGIVGAVALDVLLTPDLGVLNSEIDWVIESAGSPRPPSQFSWSKNIELAGTTWLLTVTPTEDSLATLAGTPTWAVVGMGLVLTLVLAALAHELAERTRDRRRIAALQQTARDKDRFLATVSHEIRTPLTVVTGYSHELRDRGERLAAGERTSILSELAQQADEMTAIIEDLLVAARTDIRNVQIHHELIDLRSQVVESIPPIDGGRITISSDTATAFADPGRVKQIVRNLITNASRYGGPNVFISFEEDRATASVIVADDGDPIPRDRRDAIFDPYISAHDENADVGSIGLGLYVSRELAQLMNGDLTYDHDGEHALFKLTLPRGLSEMRSAPADRPVPATKS